jgi:hypothetical protein
VPRLEGCAYIRRHLLKIVVLSALGVSRRDRAVVSRPAAAAVFLASGQRGGFAIAQLTIGAVKRRLMANG